MAKSQEKSQAPDKKEPCPACGCDEYDHLTTICPHCDTQKCERCDMGDSSECAACCDILEGDMD